MNSTDSVEALGERLKQARLNLDLTQQDVATQAGISRKAVINAEKGKTQLDTFVAILYALGLQGHLDLFLPPQPPSPIQLEKRQGNKRRRASGTKTNEHQDEPSW
ncbi:helix-turn-helix transcriptional regulator [Aliiglaciecola sp. LCG003]|uniref:helix-turn-helix transcriptional regulator n=1 Tax=Aliiglaciecola sp. LCG003 TaxID=3053655 RepID=UPI002572D74A|nr:helix-turn-helix transcriptional regulator [Aliiglaciecola sp. LCG003]WJG10861.1 helix-turn-helix transcriptional regulator [Aliiglaciecola sp. LCG003]